MGTYSTLTQQDLCAPTITMSIVDIIFIYMKSYLMFLWTGLIVLKISSIVVESYHISIPERVRDFPFSLSVDNIGFNREIRII